MHRKDTIRRSANRPQHRLNITDGPYRAYEQSYEILFLAFRFSTTKLSSPYTISLIPFPGPNLPNPTPRLQLFFLSLLPSVLTSRLSPLNLATNSRTGLRLLSILPPSAMSGLVHRGTPKDSNVGVRLRARLTRLSFVPARLERGFGGDEGSGGLVV
jgi:hypothetical protein